MEEVLYLGKKTISLSKEVWVTVTENEKGTLVVRSELRKGWLFKRLSIAYPENTLGLTTKQKNKVIDDMSSWKFDYVEIKGKRTLVFKLGDTIKTVIPV